MVDLVLDSCRVLIVEDEYALADELCQELRRVGAIVIGKVGHLQGAIEFIQAESEIDLAVLDVNLRGEAVFPLADILAARGVPMVFVTGYDAKSIPSRFAHNAALVKPVALSTLIKALSSMQIR